MVTLADQGFYTALQLLLQGTNQGMEYFNMHKPKGTEWERVARAQSDMETQKAQRQNMLDSIAVENSRISASNNQHANEMAIKRAALLEDAKARADQARTAAGQLALGQAGINADMHRTNLGHQANMANAGINAASVNSEIAARDQATRANILNNQIMLQSAQAAQAAQAQAPNLMMPEPRAFNTPPTDARSGFNANPVRTTPAWLQIAAIPTYKR
jgi:hypothetical protein